MMNDKSIPGIIEKKADTIMSATKSVGDLVPQEDKEQAQKGANALRDDLLQDNVKKVSQQPGTTPELRQQPANVGPEWLRQENARTQAQHDRLS